MCLYEEIKWFQLNQLHVQGEYAGDIVVARAQPVRLTYQPPASSTFLSEQTSHQ
jgi:hypothetical protein